MMRRVADLIAENEFWLLLVYGVPLLFARNLPPLVFFAALATIPFFWLARRVARGAWTVATPLDLPLVILVGLGLLSVIISDARETSLQFYGEWIGGIALYYGIVNGVMASRRAPPQSDAAVNAGTGVSGVGDRNIALGVWALLLLGTAMALVGLLGVRVSVKFLPLPFLDLLPKLDLDFLNPRGFTPNIVAGALAPLVPLALAWVMVQRERRLKLLVGVIALVLLGVVVLTQSRGALLGLVIACALLPLLHNPRRVWLVPAILIPAAIVVFLLGPSNVFQAVVVSDTQGSAGERVELWDRALRMLRDFPFTGIGLGLFEPTVVSLYPLLYSPPGAPLPHAHNLYLEMGVEFGVGGLLAFLALLTTLLGVGWQAIKRAANDAQRWLAAGLLASVIVFMGHSWLDAIFVSTKVSVIIWSLFGLVMALFLRERERENEMTPTPLEQGSVPTAPPTQQTRRGWISLALGAVVSLIAFWLIARSVNFGESLNVLSSSNWVFVLGATLVQLSAMGFSTRRWQVLLSPYPTRFRTLLQIFFSAHLLNTLLPFKLGTVARVLLAAETEKLNVGFVLGSVALEKVLDTFVMLLLLLALTPFVPMPEWVRDSLTASVLLVIVAVVALASVRRLREPLLAGLERLERRIFKRESVRLTGFVRGILESFGNLTQRRELAFVLLWTLFIWLAGWAVNQLLFFALGMDVPWSAAWFVMVVLQIGTRVPALPANLGVFHYLVILALGVYGVDQSAALAYAILLHLIVFVIPAILGVGFAVPLSARLIRLVTDKNARALGPTNL